MPTKDATELDAKATAKLLIDVLGEAEILQIARDCRFIKRQRDVTALGLLVACMSTLGSGVARWLADILRTFNAMTGKSVQYKPFHKQLSKRQFPEFIRRVLERILSELTMPVLESLPKGKLSKFVDIRLHDGSSFALKDDLAGVWPGRFTKVSPAAVELHVTMSALADNPVSIVLAADKDSERAYAPKATDLKGVLLLEDRGYQDRRFFRDTQDAGGFYIVRGTKNIVPTILTAHDESGRRLRHLEGKKLSWARLPAHHVDLEIEWSGKGQTYRGRLVVLYKKGKRNRKTFVYLHTNLSRTEFSIAEVGLLYRLRWQVELLFKEYKSHANLHRFDTVKAPIAEGLIWASIAVATLKRSITHMAERILQVELSTQRAAGAAKHYLDDVLRSLLQNGRFLIRVLRRTLHFFANNLRRAHPARDRKKGRLAAGLRHMAAA